MNKGDLCLFFVDVPNTSMEGFMPLDGQYGFIFNYNNNPTTLAHELAHGAFNLRHTFSSKAQYQLTQRTTQNLLDYTNSTELWKYQWDLIHNPETILLGFMQNEEEGAMINSKVQIERIIKAIHDANESGNPVYKVEKLGRYDINYSKNVDIDGKIYEIAMLSNPYINSVDLSNYLITPSGKAFYRTGKFIRISFRDVAVPKRVFDIVINETDADVIGKYLLGEKWQKDFSPMDKSWVLYLHSPEQSDKFLSAYAENDLLEQRRIAYYALTNGFVDSNGNESNWIQTQLDTNPYNYSATLRNNPYGEEGVTVYLYEKDENGYVRLKQEPIVYNPFAGSNFDATYPVDVDLYDGPQSPPLGKIKYKDYDFNGRFIEADASIGGTYGIGIITGRMKGFGYLEFTYDVMGMTWPIGASIAAGLIEGRFIRAGGGIPSPNSFGGYGYLKFQQADVLSLIGLSTGTWYGVGTTTRDKTWDGKIVGASFSISSAKFKGLWQSLNNAGGGQVQTRTVLIYPKMSSKTFNILDSYYDKP